MKNKALNRRVKAPSLLGERLVGMVTREMKQDVARARQFGLDESKVVRLSVERVLPDLLSQRLVYQNGKLVPVATAPALQFSAGVVSSTPPTGTEGGA